ncbi:MAG: hypothetical protein ACPGNV_12120 [Mangrovicoccus sp.]
MMFTFPFATIQRFPLSGDVNQEIQPELTVGDIAGNAHIEAKIQRDVASNGRQLKILIEAVSALSMLHGHDLDMDKSQDPEAWAALPKELQVLSELKYQIRELIDQDRELHESHAIRALDTLKRVHPEAHDEMISRRARSETAGANAADNPADLGER